MNYSTDDPFTQIELVDDIVFDFTKDCFYVNGRKLDFSDLEREYDTETVDFVYEFLEFVNLLPKLETEIDYPKLILNRRPTKIEERELRKECSGKLDDKTFIIREGYWVAETDDPSSECDVMLYETEIDGIYYCPFDGLYYEYDAAKDDFFPTNLKIRR